MPRRDKDDILASLEKNLPVLPKRIKSIVDQGQINNDTENDVEYSRQKMKELIDLSSEAINNMMSLAVETEHPRAFEVLSNMIKQSSEMSQDLIKLQKTRKDITQTKDDNERNNTTNNSIFVGSTKELQKFLKERDKLR
tara:strand:- start:809 stop:1225 length:417 start_codon:yes stop_codon:yes gene_type:complete